MIKILPILTCIFLTLYTSGQECEYAEYFRLTDLAKKQCHSKNYKDAKQNFKLAFATTDFPLGHDLSFALISANETKDELWAGLIAEKLAKGGVPLRYFSKFKKKKWYKKFESEFQKYAEYYDENVEEEFRTVFLSLIKKDQDFAEQLMKLDNREIKLSFEQATETANAILAELKTLTDNYGFPSEENMGYNYVRRLNRVEYYKTGVLLIHIFKYGELIYEKEIPNIICDGNLHSNYQQILKQSRGFGNSTGIEQEMKIRFTKYSQTD